MTRLFGTDGIRSVAGQWPLTAEFTLRIGQVVAQVVSCEEGTKPQVIIGRDPRLSGHMLESALTAGLTSQGVDTMLVGVIPTPGVAYLTRTHKAPLGIVISASHNPFDHNGIKIFGSSGFKISDETECEIERMLLDDNVGAQKEFIDRPGQSRSAYEWQEEYLNHLICTWEEDNPLKDKHIVLDCANGATSVIAPDVFRRLGAKVTAMENSPDGLNINERYEYIRPESVRAAVLKEKAFVGVAFDGDGDRVMLVDEKGGFINGDAMLAILARDMKQKGLLSNNTVVSTPMSNWGLKASLEEAGIRLEETSVGDRFVLQRMIEENYTLGGEQSGHIIMLGDGRTTGDGIYTALAVLKAVMNQADQSLYALTNCMRELPECLLSIDIPSKPPLQMIPEVHEGLQKLHTTLGEHVDINLRYSGTEDKLRLKIRADAELSQEMLEHEAEAFMAVAGRAIKRIHERTT